MQPSEISLPPPPAYPHRIFQLAFHRHAFVIPTLESLDRDGKVRAGGIAAGTLARAFVVEAKSKDEVTEFVRALPASSIMQCKVTPIETFARRADIEKKVVQGLRAQK